MIKNIKQSIIVKIIYKAVFKFFGFFPSNKKMIIFESYLGKQFSCNPRAIYEYINLHYPDYKLYWSIDPRYESAFLDKDLNIIHRFSLKWLFKMTRARYWVFNSRAPSWVPKPKHTVYLQTWHGTPLKKLANDMEEVHMPGTTTKKYKQNFLNETKRWDFLISPNNYSTNHFKSAFSFENQILETGYPRNDYLFTHNNLGTINSIKEKLNLPKNKKIILYAPTWRDDEYHQVGKYKFDLKLDLTLLKKELGQEYIILLRMHYLIADKVDLTGYEDFVYNVTSHEDIRDLYLISDVLLTDYSSVIFDFANLKRPMIFFVYDIDSYRDKLRGFYFNIEENAPGPLVKNNQDLLRAILNSNYILEGYNYTLFFNRFCNLESGESTKKVVKKVFL